MKGYKQPPECHEMGEGGGLSAMTFDPIWYQDGAADGRHGVALSCAFYVFVYLYGLQTVALFVLYCIVMYILCKQIESHFTK